MSDEQKSQLQELRDRLEQRGMLQNPHLPEDYRESLEKVTPPVQSTEGLRDLLQLSADEFEEVTANADKERMAQLAEAEGKPELARLIRGNVTPQELAEEGMHKALVEYAESLGGVVVSSRLADEEITPEEADRRAIMHELEKLKQDNRLSDPILRLTPEQQKEIEQNLSSSHMHPHIIPNPPSAGRIMEMLHTINDRMQKIEEEVLFTSSANRFAHLRSGIEQKDNGKFNIPHLPPAPDWNTLEAYVEPFLRDIVDHIQGAPILRERATVAGIVPFDVLKGVDIVGEELLRIVGERGRAYGEEAILAMGEAGMISMIMSKVMRLMWSHRAGLQFQARRDSYIDLAGYCLLTIALDVYIMENSGKEENTSDVENGDLG